MHWNIVLPTQKKEKTSQRFSNLALISVTWQQNTLCVERRLPPECPEEGEAVISWAISWVPLLPPSVCQRTSWISKYCFSLIFFFVLNFEYYSFSPYIHNPKRNQLCVCVYVCMYLKGFVRGKLHSHKFITAAKLIVSSVEDELGKKNTEKCLWKMQCQLYLIWWSRFFRVLLVILLLKLFQVCLLCRSYRLD